VRMDEKERVAQKIAVSDPDAWNNQMYKVRVLDQLVYCVGSKAVLGHGTL